LFSVPLGSEFYATMHTELYNIYIYIYAHNTPLFFSELFNAEFNFVKEKMRCMLMVKNYSAEKY